MNIEDLALEKRIYLGAATFVAENNVHTLKIERKNKSFIDREKDEFAEKPVLFVYMYNESHNYFLAEVDRDKKGILQEPLKIESGTPEGNLYKEFCEFITKEPFNIKSEPYKNE